MCYVGIYDAIAHFNNGEKAVLDIMELLKIDPGYYMTKCFFFFQKKQQDKNIENEGTSYEKPHIHS